MGAGEQGGADSVPRLPPVRPAEVSRTDLIERFEAQRDRKVVLVTAPAGYGKSIFAAQWCASDPERSAGWVALTEAHDDPVVLMSDVDQIRRALDATGPSVLVLDDVHRVTNEGSVALLDRLLDALPERSQAVLVSRDEPSIGVARRRANGELMEVGARDLAMDLSLTERFLAAAQVAIDADAAAALQRTTEGWPAGIGLAALAHASTGTANGHAPGPGGGHRHISDYLVDEVLLRQDAPMREFLLQSSVLSRFSAALCDTVLGATGSAELIARMERTNLFVIPLDERRGWYRYHHLFHDLLGEELDRTQPGARLPLLRAAAAWHDEHGTVEEALRYSQDGGDQQRAGRLVLRNWQEYASRGQIETLRSWVARSTDAEICSDPSLSIGAAWVSVLLGDGERAERYAAAAATHDLDGPSPDGATSLRSSLANLRSGLGSGGVTQMLEDGLLVQAAERPTRTRWLLGGCRAVGTAHLLLGHHDDAIAALDEALLLTENRPELRSVRIFCLGYLALALLEQGDTSRAKAISDDAAALLRSDGGVIQTFQALPARTARSAVLALRGDRAAAARRGHRHRRVARRHQRDPVDAGRPRRAQRPDRLRPRRSRHRRVAPGRGGPERSPGSPTPAPSPPASTSSTSAPAAPAPSPTP